MSKHENGERSGAKVKKMTATDCAATFALVVCVLAVGAVWFIMPGVVEQAQANYDPRPSMVFVLMINPMAYIGIGFFATYILQKWLKKQLTRAAKLAVLGAGLVCIVVWVAAVVMQSAKAYELILYYPGMFAVPGALMQLGTGKV